MDRKLFKKIMSFRMEHKDKVKDLTPTQQLDIVRESIKAFDETNPGPFSGYYNTIVALEEFGELIQELTKALRGNPSRTGILEELADVSLNVDYLKEIFSISDEELNQARIIKMQRVKNKLKIKNKLL